MSPTGSPPDAASFNRQVWDVVRGIPRGRVATYGHVARLVPLPSGVDPDTYRAFGARWVGSALAACPDDVPWQRVLNAKGEISLRAGAEHQRRLLEAEGVAFDAKGRVDLARFGWQGPEDAEQPALF
jgi:methylated-DNA-protein-cysteine methyltransferase related protein